jgi:hypothetical protein
MTALLHRDRVRRVLPGRSNGEDRMCTERSRGVSLPILDATTMVLFPVWRGIQQHPHTPPPDTGRHVGQKPFQNADRPFGSNTAISPSGARHPRLAQWLKDPHFQCLQFYMFIQNITRGYGRGLRLGRPRNASLAQLLVLGFNEPEICDDSNAMQRYPWLCVSQSG